MPSSGVLRERLQPALPPLVGVRRRVAPRDLDEAPGTKQVANRLLRFEKAEPGHDLFRPRLRERWPFPNHDQSLGARPPLAP